MGCREIDASFSFKVPAVFVIDKTSFALYFLFFPPTSGVSSYSILPVHCLQVVPGVRPESEKSLVRGGTFDMDNVFTVFYYILYRNSYCSMIAYIKKNLLYESHTYA